MLPMITIVKENQVTKMIKYSTQFGKSKMSSPKLIARCVLLRVMVKIMDLIPLIVCFQANGITFSNFGGTLFGNVVARFVMNSELDGKRAGPGWMHLLDLPGDGTALGCGMPPPGTVGPLLRKLTTRMVFVFNVLPSSYELTPPKCNWCITWGTLIIYTG